MKRTVLYSLIFLVVGWVLVPTARAQAINPDPTAQEFGAVVTDYSAQGKMGKEIYTKNTQTLYENSLTCSIGPCSTAANSPVNYEHSAIAEIQGAMVALYVNPPANFALWYHTTLADLGFEPKQAYAQGIGFSGLSVLLPIWTGFRNIAYALLAIVMIIIGFMIMFRKKIDPKTVVTVQNALPRIVITLLLITFSYAIVGLLIDLMYLAIAFIAAILIPASGGALGADTGSKYVNGGIWNLLMMLWNGSWGSGSAITDLLLNSFPVVHLNVGIIHIGVNALITVIVAIALLFAYVQILFLLVGAYIQILLSLFIGPLQILTEAIPGSTGFSSWLKNLFANIAVFPITAGLLMIGTILANFNQNGVKIWTPPLLSSGGATGWVGLIGLGVMFSIPPVANSLKEALKAKSPVNAGIGGMISPIVSGGSQMLNLAYEWRMLFGGGGHGQETNPAQSAALPQGIKAAQGKTPGSGEHS